MTPILKPSNIQRREVQAELNSVVRDVRDYSYTLNRMKQGESFQTANQKLERMKGRR